MVENRSMGIELGGVNNRFGRFACRLSPQPTLGNHLIEIGSMTTLWGTNKSLWCRGTTKCL